MPRLLLSISLVALLLSQLIARPICAAPVQGEDGAQRIKEDVRCLIQAGESHVKIKLRDNRQLKGYITSVGDDRLALSNLKFGNTTTVLYSDVAKVKRIESHAGLVKAIGLTGTIVGIFVIVIVSVPRD